MNKNVLVCTINICVYAYTYVVVFDMDWRSGYFDYSMGQCICGYW